MDIENRTNYIRKNMKFREEVVARVEKLAEKENRSFTNMVETILLKQTEAL